MAAITRKLGPKSGENVRLEIDLRELFGGEVADRPAARQALAQDVIDAIVKNATEGKDAKGGQLKRPYSPSYVDSLEFKAFGKSKNDVNMSLTGSMLAAIDIIAHSKNKIVIGWEQGSEDGAKAHGNITGKNGQVKTKRDFFGLPEGELERIAARYADDITAAPEERQTVRDILEALDQGIRFF